MRDYKQLDWLVDESPQRVIVGTVLHGDSGTLVEDSVCILLYWPHLQAWTAGVSGTLDSIAAGMACHLANQSPSQTGCQTGAFKAYSPLDLGQG